MDRQSRLEMLLDRYENPEYKGIPEHADVDLEGGNPGCGDIVHLYLIIEDDKLVGISFDGEGCTISQASSDILAEYVEGKSIQEINDLDHEIITELLGEEIVQNRTKCALLPLDTLKLALRKYREQQLTSSS